MLMSRNMSQMDDTRSSEGMRWKLISPLVGNEDCSTGPAPPVGIIGKNSFPDHLGRVTESAQDSILDQMTNLAREVPPLR